MGHWSCGHFPTQYDHPWSDSNDSASGSASVEKAHPLAHTLRIARNEWHDTSNTETSIERNNDATY